MSEKKKIMWGADPELFGPKDWFRNSLLIQEISKRLASGNILDYGCGTGICLLRLIAKGYFMTGIDISQRNIDYLNTKLGKRSNVRVFVGDISSLKKMQTTYDAVLCGETLEHIKNDKILIKAFYHALRPGGYIFLSVPAHQHLWTEIDEYAGHFRRYSKQSISDVLSGNGFFLESIYYWGYPLGLLWDKYVSAPLLRKKMKENITYTDSSSIIGQLLRISWLKILLSYIFYIDSLFFYDNKRGQGIIVVAKKNI